MDVRHQAIINMNMPELVKRTNHVGLIVDDLVRKRIITETSAEQILYSSLDPVERARRLFSLIKKCGPWAFTSLIESLNATQNEVVALLLNEKRMFNNTPPEGTSPVEEDVGFFNEGIYRMKSHPRGSVLIVNVFQYDYEWRERRDGSLKDVEDLDKLFTDMGFHVCRSPSGGTKDDIENALKLWRNNPILTSVDCGIIILMAHGTEGITGSVHIQTSDRQTIDSESIINGLSSSEAPLLHGKPKLVFILSCRGKYADLGTNIDRVLEIQNLENRNNSQLEAMSFDTHGRFEGYAPVSPHLKDILVVYPCAPGKASLRDPEMGAWFVQEMIKVFRNRAQHDDVETMLKKVDRNLILQRQQGIKERFQTVCCTSRGFDKFLFLNPISSFSSSSFILDSKDFYRPGSSNGNYA